MSQNYIFGIYFPNLFSVHDYITEAEAKKLLGRKTTWFWQMRTSGRLPFSKVGNKVFYNRNDIAKLLTDNRQNHFSDAA
ncbi:MAG: helix-turn-helix domain-containing protein [Bacteroidetes bacterium]|nr:helix-turn-helix domain-containing protein [Bacteroidota bacterium]